MTNADNVGGRRGITGYVGKKQVYVVTTWLKEEDEEGTPLNWTSPGEEHYAETLKETEKMKERFLAGKDEFICFKSFKRKNLMIKLT